MEKLSLSPDVEQVEIGRSPEQPLAVEEAVEDKAVENETAGEDEAEIDQDTASFEALQDRQRAEDEEPPEDCQDEDTIDADNLAIEPELLDEEDEEPQSNVTPQAVVLTPIEGGDDFQRIRAIDAELEQRLKAEGITSFEHIAAWRAADVQRLSQTLGIPGRIDREQWVEQAQILAKGGETYYSRNRLAALKAATAASIPQIAEPVDASPAETLEESEEPSPPAEAVSEAAYSAPASEQVPPAPETTAKLSGVAAASQGRSVAEMAAAAAAAIAAASASVTRGLKPIEPISPLSKVDPKISIPAKLSDAIKEKEAASTPAVSPVEMEPPRPMSAASHGPSDDLKRIRGVGVLIEKRLNAMGISRYEQIANWTSGDIDRVSQMLEFKGRIEREGWVEQARILLSGGYTEFSRRVDRGEVDTSRET
jgi:predicted flap endonuclease-1-like 5' DNA nuclease